MHGLLVGITNVNMFVEFEVFVIYKATKKALTSLPSVKIRICRLKPNTMREKTHRQKFSLRLLFEGPDNSAFFASAHLRNHYVHQISILEKFT